METGTLTLLSPFQVVDFSSLEITSSTNVFHSLHCGHFPNHFGDCVPQFWQKNAD